MVGITVDDAFKLQAFLQALDKLEPSLGESLVEEINAVGKCLIGDRDNLIFKIEDACEKNTTLEDLFAEELHELGKRYQFGERQKAKPLQERDRTKIPEVKNKVIRVGQILKDENNPIEAIKKEKDVWSQILEFFMRP